jgi:hypothetical protein
MNAEFLKKLEEACLKNSIDITENWGEELILMYRGTTFNLQCWEEEDGLNTSLTVTDVIVKGKTFNYQTYPFIDVDLSGKPSTNIDDVLYEIIEAILDCNIRQRVVKLVNMWDSFIEDIPLEDQEMLKSYIKYKL